MNTTHRLFVLVCLLLVVGGGVWWWSSPEQSTPSTSVLLPAPEKSPDPALPAEIFVPTMPIASIQESDAVQFVPIAGAKNYTITPESMLTLKVKKTGGSYQGNLPIRQGAVQVVEGKVVGGGFVLDIEKLSMIDSMATGLTSIFKEEDFFAVDTYPTGSFVLQEVDGGQIVGVLTLKGISKKVSFPAVVIVEEDSVMILAEVALERNQRTISGGGAEMSEFIELSFIVRLEP